MYLGSKWITILIGRIDEQSIVATQGHQDQDANTKDDQSLASIR